jgi:hypothetical protein
LGIFGKTFSSEIFTNPSVGTALIWCKKSSVSNNQINPVRSVMLGNYHFKLTRTNSNHPSGPFDTTLYNGEIVAGPDGNSILITYPDSAHQTKFNTSDSSFFGGVSCPMGQQYSALGNYSRDTLRMSDYAPDNSGCPGDSYAALIGVRY